MKIFKETQRFNQWWLIALLVLTLIVVVYNFIKELQVIESGGDSKITTTIVFGMVTIGVVYLIFSMKLKTRIDETGITYQFSPIHLKPKKITWTELNKCYVRKYSPIKEYGGWGFRGVIKPKIFGVRGKGKAYNISGNTGIQLEFNDGGKLLIGTQESEKAKRVIKRYSDKLNTNSKV